jgi:ketosteroid isomerase-like protein
MSELISLVRAMDQCWIERRFDDLVLYIAEDVVMVTPGGKNRMQGRDSAIESYREFMQRCHVLRYEPTDYIVTHRGDSAVIEYAWDMAWDDAGNSHEAKGRDVLVFARRNDEWRVIWRTQLPG